jgi:hypothetical protein
MEKVCCAFKIPKGRLDYLKLYQVTRYLKGELG